MPSIIGLIDDTAQWLQTEKNSDQWQRPWPDRPARDQRIRRGIKVARTWTVENDDGLVGTVSFGRGGNKKLWTLRERNQPAVYVSRLIVSRAMLAKGSAPTSSTGPGGVARLTGGRNGSTSMSGHPTTHCRSTTSGRALPTYGPGSSTIRGTIPRQPCFRNQLQI